MNPNRALYEPAVLTPDASLPEVPLHPAPWQLRAEGYVVVVQMPEAALDSAAFVPQALGPKRRSRTSVLMFIAYKQAVCGVYQELLVAPASFASAVGTHPSITRIYVSSYDSLVNGRINWGIPKDIAEFQRDTVAASTGSPSARNSDGPDCIRVSRDGHTFAELRLRAYGPALPVRTWLLPVSVRTLVQHWNGNRYHFTLRARGRARLAKVEHWQFDPEYFPDLARGRVLTASYLPDFEMTFPVPRVEPYL